MIREERDPGFWIDVASHPQVSHVLAGLPPESVANLLTPQNVPLASENGGLIFVRADSFGRAYELHTVFKPKGWGREAFDAARQAFDLMFARCDLILTHETDHPQSRPPKTFRFVPLGDLTMTDLGPARLWMLTREAWANSPARSR